MQLSLLFHPLISISALPTNTFKSVVVVFKPIMLLWLVIMRLQDLIPVIVSLRRSESERRWCGFTPRGGKGGRGHKPLTDGRARLSPTPPFNQRPRRPMRLELSPPINPNQPITEKQGGGPSSNCCGSNVGPQSDRGGKKRKSNSRKEKSLDCGTRSERRGTRFFY